MRLPLFTKKLFWIGLVLVLGMISVSFLMGEHQVDFNTEVKPLFNKYCITCHGGVKQQSGFSLLFRNDALAVNKSGKPAIIPGDPAHSELIRRLSLSDPEERMPYKHPPLTADEISTLKHWIKQGAKWGEHWAYQTVTDPAVPKVDNWFFGIRGGGDWVRNDIDHFVYARMQEQGLQPSPEADKATLLRRVSMDITGLPPSAQLAQQFLSDNRPDAYERLVDTLLASPHYGEKWAAMWMDLARYADTKGYERDDWRSIWRYRDWLIHAFNDNKPYNIFLTEQLAGDLMPHATDEQYIATAFQRNTMTNDEGGTDNEEFRTAAVLDRVNTTWEALMGTTFACVQCHSHPYDPFRHDEYYAFMAFFNNTRDEDTYDDYPLLREYKGADSIKQVQLDNWLQVHAPQRANAITHFVKTLEPAINSIAADHLQNSALTDTKWLVLRNGAVARLPQVGLDNHTTLLVRYKSWKPGGIWDIRLDAPDGPVYKKVNVKETKGGWYIATVDVPAVTGTHDLYFGYRNANISSPAETGMQFDWFHFTDPFPGKGQPGYDSAYSYFNQLIQSRNVTITPVMVENTGAQRRATHVFERGNWLVKGAAVQPDIPHYFGGLPKGAPRNRLGLALWITDPRNPLTARTIVNRVWEQFFGQGIAETLEDLGTQGIPPTHRELLDHLAWQLVHTDHWDLKQLMKKIVLSATYRQDSRFNKETLQKDPFNKWLARGPRVRLTAEEIRDASLVASGLLSGKMYGPGVYPYQPEGIWMSPWNGAYWKESENGDQYRRALYTYWKRSAPYPSMMTFDGTSHEVCTARRIRTNTPLQSLTTLNDSAYLDMAQHLAYRMLQEGGNTPQSRIRKGYEWLMYRPLSDAKLQALDKLYNQSMQSFRNNEENACEMAGVAAPKKDAATASLVVVANAMLNLDEFITKN